MAVRTVFISSVIDGFEEIRAGAAQGIERVGKHPVMAERLPAVAASPRRALLDEAGSCDIYLLLLGIRYGEMVDGGTSPTEQEYEEAVRCGRPVLVLVQDVEREPEQEAFLERIRGNWGSGVLYDRFANETDVAVAVAGALARHETSSVENPDRASEQAQSLAGAEDRFGGYGGEVTARLALVPLRETLLLDPVALEDSELASQMMQLARADRLISQSAGIESAVSAEGVTLKAASEGGYSATEITISIDGAICAKAPVGGEGNFGGSLVNPDRLRSMIASVGVFAQDVWKAIDPNDEVGRVAIALAIPNAQHTGFGASSGSSMSMGHGLPPLVRAAEAPDLIPRGQVSDTGLIDRLIAGIRRVYLDAGAVQDS